MRSNKGKKFPVEILNQDEQQRLLNSFTQSKTGVRNKALLSLYLKSQLRCNEALDLRPCDIDLESRTVVVLHGKGGKRRVSALGGGSLDALQEWLRIRPDSPYLFCTCQGKRLCDSYIRQMIKRQSTKIGLHKRVHAHGLRHTGAVELANSISDIRIIQRQLGHSNIAVTDRYINHLCPARAIEAINAVRW